MSELLLEMNNTAQRLGIPLGVQLDLTYRCNERCVPLLSGSRRSR